MHYHATVTALKKSVFLGMILFLLLVSCSSKDGKKLFLKDSIDLSTLGSINSVKIINGNVYLLDGTNSAIYELTDDSLQKILDVEIKGRDFLQDFAINDSLYYLANTYDSIYTAGGKGEIREVSYISSPDNVVIMNRWLYISERIPASANNIVLRKINLSNEDQVETVVLDKVDNGGKGISGNIICGCKEHIYLLSNKSRAIYGISTAGDVKKYLFADGSEKFLRFGKFIVEETERRGMVLAENEQGYWLTFFQLTGDVVNFTERQRIDREFDIQVSAVAGNSVYLYDYLNSQLEVFQLK